MTPEQKIKHLILNTIADLEELERPVVTEDNVDELYDECDPGDALYEIREGEIETDIPCETSRHYESKSVAAQAPDGSWVGWTYWYGGGKHGQPDLVPWMSESYNLVCHEEEKLVVVRTFSIAAS